MRSLKKPKGQNLLHALQWTPVIYTEVGQGPSHAIVVIEYCKGNNTIINPCGIEVVSFDEGSDSCKAATLPRKQGDVDNKLGTYICTGSIVRRSILNATFSSIYWVPDTMLAL